MSENSNLPIKDRFIAAVLAGETGALEQLMDPAFELHHSADLPYGGIYRGADGFNAFLARFNDTFAIDVLNETAAYPAPSGDSVVVEIELKATIRASGRPFETTMLEVWSFRGGKVHKIKPHYFNKPAG